MAEVNYYLRDSSSKKETGIMLFLSFNGHRIKIKSIKDKINPKYWDKSKQRVKQSSSLPTYPEFNARLELISNACLNVYRRYLNDNDQIEPLPKTIKDLILKQVFLQEIDTPENEESFKLDLISFAEYITNEIRIGRRVGKSGLPLSNSIYKIYKTHTGVLLEFQKQKNKKIVFSEIDLNFYYDFLSFLTNVKKYSQNTVRKHIRTLKGLLNYAERENINIKINFRKEFIAPEEEESEAIYLDIKELKNLWELDLSNNSRLERVRDLFLVGCWTGLRFSDFTTISKKNIKNGLIEIRAKKTGKKVVIPILYPVNEILKKYEGLTENNLPPSLSNQKMNKYLKELGELAGLTEIIPIERTKAGKTIIKNVPKFSMITTHSARRSFATNAYNLKVPTLSIMAITGHRSESNFLKYIKVTPEQHALITAEIFNRQNILKVV